MKTFQYCFFVWITCIVIGPFISFFLGFFTPDGPHLYLDLVLYGFIFSIPSFLISLLAVAIARQIRASSWIKKLLLSVLSAVLIALPLHYLKGGWGPQTVQYSIAYVIVAIGGIWLITPSVLSSTEQ